MKRKINLLLSACLCLSVAFGSFSLPVALAYEKENVNFGQVKPETAPNNSGASLNKINSVSRSTNTLSQIEVSTDKENGYIEGEILVKYKNNKINLNTVSGRTAASNFTDSKSLEKKEDLRKNNISVVRINDAKTVEQKIAELRNDPNVEYAQPNYQYYPTDINTDDTNKDLLWGLDNIGQTVGGTYTTNNPGSTDKDIDAPEAWVISEATISASAIVAVIDSGVAYNHPDLLANMWDGSACVGEDSNGVALSGGCNHGYDYQDNDKTPLPTSSSHGTHIAGTIAAVKNNGKGIMGVAPQAKIMAIKSSLTTIDNVKSINFAGQNGAKVINASWGGHNSDQALKDAIDLFPGIFVAAAGNGEEFGDPNIGDIHDSEVQLYPCDFNSSNIICVTATDQQDNIVTWADYGATSVDVSAPGTNIYSTVADSPVMSENFDSITPPAAPDGWVKSGTNNNWGTYDLDGGISWGNVLYGDLAFPYATSSDTTITSETYNLSSGGANIDFWAKCDTEYITDGWADYMQLEYSADGVNFSPATDPYFGGEFRWDEPTFDFLKGENPLDSASGSIFHYENISIPIQYLTSNFKFQFRWVTNGNVDTGDGCLVDDVKITKFSDGSDNLYAYENGTSMAAPHVAGLAALVEGYNPSLTFAQVKNTILTTGDSVASLSDKTVSGKRINAFNALNSVTPSVISDVLADSTAPTSAIITWLTDELSSSKIAYSTSTPVASIIVSDDTFVTEHSFELTDLTASTTYYFYVESVDEDGNVAASAEESFTTLSGSEVSGNITEDTTWTLAGSPYEIVDTLQIFDDIILTIEEGVEVKIETGKLIKIAGTLIVNGTNINPVTFTSLGIGKWGGIEFIDSNNSQINNSIIENAGRAVDLKGISVVPMVGNIFKNNEWVVTDTNGYQKMYFVNNTVYDNSDVFYGIRTIGNDNVFRNNTFRNNSSVFHHGDYFDITTIDNNNFINNTFVIKAPEQGYGYGTVSIIDNWWNTTDTNVVDNLISDKNDDVALQLLDYLPIKTSEINDIGSPITTQDIIAPVITLLGDDPVDITVGDTYEDAGATALDDVDGDLTASIVTVNPVDENVLGTYIVTYNVSDSAGNDADEVTRTVNVNEAPEEPDTTVPTLVSYTVSEIIISPNDDGVKDSSSIDIRYSEEVSAEINILDSDEIKIRDLYSSSSVTNPHPQIWDGKNNSSVIVPDGVYTIQILGTDPAGNVLSDISKTITVDTELEVISDTESPVIEFRDDVTSEATSSDGAEVDYTPPNATDNVDATESAVCLPASELLFAIGTTEVTCDKTDTAGNVATTTTFNIIVQDTTPPEITLNGNAVINLAVGGEYIEDGTTASDIVDGDLTEKIVKGGDAVDPSTVGTYVITYNVSDSANNPAVEVTRTVNVNIAPLSSTKAITAFSFPEGIGVINETNHTIFVNVPSGTNVAQLTSTISITTGATINVHDAVQDFTSPVTYAISAEDGSTQEYIVTVIILVSTQIAPNESGDVTADSTTPEVVITNPTQSVNITISSETTAPTINVSSFIAGGSGILPEINITSANANNVNIAISASTTVTSASTTWDGVIAAPALITVTLPETSGQTKTLSTAIEIGFIGAELTFNNAVRLLLPGQAGKRVGYIRTGITFTEILNTCSADNQTTGDALVAGGECKIDVGSDLVIWTKHFTSFATYTQTSIPAPTPAPSGGGGGGGTYTPPPVAIKGDINNDKKVDKYDFALIMANWGKTGFNSADLNSDNKVDKYDFALLMSNWSN
ncbi:MAG: S8 family serine peptidase [bacterium]|nr:S8 family serine peptidase [bacterium]